MDLRKSSEFRPRGRSSGLQGSFLIVKTFAEKLVVWQRAFGRQDLPWQKTRDPYLRWVSEIMLQQTQVATVIPYYEAFVRDYPTASALAAADEEAVLRHWAGLGYYSRARNLHAGAKQVAASGGSLPRSLEGLMAIPGIGRSTAGAILSSCWDEPAPILDGNAKRLLSRVFAIKRSQGESGFQKALWAVAERETPAKDCAVYTQSLMDMGSLICTRTRPRCEACPVREECLARREGDPCAYPGPAAKEKKERREERATFLAITGPRGLWLEQRRGDAVWKGLWCFPQYSGELQAAELKALIDPGKGVRLETLRKALEIKHDFTHYRLWMNVWTVQGDFEPVEGGRWFRAEEAARGALPAPVKKAAAEVLRFVEEV